MERITTSGISQKYIHFKPATKELPFSHCKKRKIPTNQSCHSTVLFNSHLGVFIFKFSLSLRNQKLKESTIGLTGRFIFYLCSNFSRKCVVSIFTDRAGPQLLPFSDAGVFRENFQFTDKQFTPDALDHAVLVELRILRFHETDLPHAG